MRQRENMVWKTSEPPCALPVERLLRETLGVGGRSDWNWVGNSDRGGKRRVFHPKEYIGRMIPSTDSEWPLDYCLFQASSHKNKKNAEQSSTERKKKVVHDASLKSGMIAFSDLVPQAVGAPPGIQGKTKQSYVVHDTVQNNYKTSSVSIFCAR